MTSTVMTSARNRRPLPPLLAGGAIAIATALWLALGGRGEHSLLTFAGRFHPLAVHLPIGLVLLVALFESLPSKLRVRSDPALAILLPVALASAVGAFALGLMLATAGGHPERLLLLHRRFAFGIVVGLAASVVTWWAHAERGASRWPHRAAVGVTVLLLFGGAHIGGSMTHGESYLLQYAPFGLGSSAQPPRPATPSAAGSASASAAVEPRLFDDVVLPILDRRCAGCHGAETAKAKLRLDSLEAMMKGGRSGPAIEPGHAARSLVIDRVRRPIDDDGHMPPEGKPQPTPEELELLTLWIDGGASATTKVRDLIVSEGARRLLVDAAARAPQAPKVEQKDAPPASAAPVDSARPPASSTPSSSASALPSSTASAAPAASASGARRQPRAFTDVVRPILAQRCGKCHSGADPSGGLIITSRSALLAGSYVVPRDPNGSSLLQRVTSPLGDEDHMPPKSKPQPSAAEIETIRKWIAGGATD